MFSFMPNTYFQCKQFVVHQDKTAMKVCTDSCLFGAWVANYLSDKNKPVKHILDIGAGTGLLSLMLAQKCCEASIDAVEVNTLSAQQARNNFAECTWKQRLHVIEGDVQECKPQHKYDFIICNPPFYENDLLGEDELKNIAHHNAGLTLRELMTAIKTLLHDEGSFAILLPYHRTKECEMLANEKGYCLLQQTSVKQTPKHSFFRSLNLFSKRKQPLMQNEICIKDANENYTSDFAFLLKDYYLHL